MDEKLLITNHPVLYHMAEPGSWPSISKLGLLSTKALLDEYGASEDERKKILKSHRPEKVTFRNHIIRDQKPMNHNLKSCLTDGITPEAWFEFLNGRVFFWTTLARLETFRAAYRKQRQTILEVPTQRMIDAHRERVKLCHINSGATRMPNHFRNFDTFQPIASFQYSSKRTPAEFTVEHSVPDITRLVSRVYEAGDGPEEVLFSSN
jgi:hypothetical protein